MNQEANILEEGFSVEQALQESSFSDIVSTKKEFFPKVPTDIPTLGAAGFGSSGIFSILALGAGIIAAPVKANPCQAWRLSEKGCIILESSLLPQEELAQRSKNHHAIIVYLGLLIESELGRTIAKPLKRFIPELCRLLKMDNPKYQTSALERWASGDLKLKPTLWTFVMLLKALEDGQYFFSKELNNRIDSLFTPPYRDSIREAHLSKAVNKFRWKYRNPCIHAEQVIFSRYEAEQACKLTLGFTTVKDWSMSIPDTKTYRPSLLSTHLILQKER